MAEATDSEGPGQVDGLPSTGELLRHAREAKGLTIQQVAQALHLDAWILEALEANRFKDIGAPVFVKGHLRKFAEEVGVTNESVMEAYYRSEDMPETPQLVTDTLTRPAGDSRGRGPVIALSVVLIVLIAIVAWLWFRGQGFEIPGVNRSASVVESTPADPDERIVPEDDTAGDSFGVAEILPAATADVEPANGDSLAAAASTTSEQATEAKDASLPESRAEDSASAPDDGSLRLGITFANDSWVEIYDGGNRRLFFDLGRAGTRRAVSGEPPLQVLLGNAEGARVTLNGEAFAIPAGARRGKTARFTVQ